MKSMAELRRWQKWACAYNWLGIPLTLLAMFWPSFNYQLLIIILMAFPLVGMLIVWRSNGSVRVDGPEVNSFHNTIVLGSSMAICSLGIRAVVDYHYLSISPLWLPAASITVAYWLLVLVVDREARKVGQVVVQFMLSAAYAASTVFLANCVFDMSPGEPNINIVTDKQISSHVKGPPSYELSVAPWKYSAESSKISVPRGAYDQLRVGEPIEIIVKGGFFDAPWVAAVKKKSVEPM